MVFLTGCNEKVLDYRNAEGSNGTVYESGSNEPFSGKLTNVPFNDLPNTSPVRLLDSLVLGSLGGILDLRRAYCDVDVQAGLLDGKAICRQPQSDVLYTEFSYKKRIVDGSIKHYDGTAKNDVVASIDADNGVLDGEVKVINPANGALIGHAKWEEGKLEGSLDVYTLDGKNLREKTEYKQGKKNGIADRYRLDTGKLFSHEEWIDGKLALTQSRDAAGNLMASHAYPWNYPNNVVPDSVAKDCFGLENCQASSSSPNNNVAAPNPELEQCIDTWAAAYRKEQGEDIIVTEDQIAEWRTWCIQGKHP